MQRRSEPTSEPAMQPREITSTGSLIELLKLDDEAFRSKFKGSPVKRTKRRGLLRNVAIALASSDDPETVVALEQACGDPEEMVREAAKSSLNSIRTRRKTRNTSE